MDKALNLLGCPFCGNDVVHVQDDYCGGAGFMVLCGNCTAEGGLSNTEKEAAEVWNRRATSTAAPDAGREGAVQTGEKTLETRMDAGFQPLLMVGAAAPGELPPLPEPYGTIPVYADDADGNQTHEVDGWTSDQMRGFACDAIAADRAQRAPDHVAAGAIASQEFLMWNRRQDAPPVAIGKELGVACKVLELDRAQRAAVEPEPAADLDALVREYGNAPVIGPGRTRRAVMQDIYRAAGKVFGAMEVEAGHIEPAPGAGIDGPDWWYRLHAAAETLDDLGAPMNATDVRGIADAMLTAEHGDDQNKEPQ